MDDVKKEMEPTINDIRGAIWPIPIAWQEIANHGASAQFSPEDVALVEEEDHRRFGKELGGTDSPPEEERVFEPIDAGIF
jgi:hypothetical protein